MQKPAAKQKKVITKSPWPSKGCIKYPVTFLWQKVGYLLTSVICCQFVDTQPKSARPGMGS